MTNKLVLYGLLLLQLTALVFGELFGRRRSPGSRRRAGDRPNTNIKYGVSNTSELFGRRRNPGSRRRAGTRNSYTPNYSVSNTSSQISPGSRRRAGIRNKYTPSYRVSMTIWYVVIGVAVAFVLALIASIVYYCVVVRKRNKEKREAEKYKPMGAGYRSKADQDREMEEYLAHVRPTKSMGPSYDQFVAREPAST